jgi:hypothetical protein
MKPPVVNLDDASEFPGIESAVFELDASTTAIDN